MIRPPERSGVAFTTAGDGDIRNDAKARSDVAARLSLNDEWATLRQVHGSSIVEAGGPGDHGEGDGLWTSRPELPIAVFTADCFGVVIHADDAVGVAHAGWRGVEAGVVQSTISSMEAAGHEPRRAEVGPGIGPCCFEVGPDVANRFESSLARTSWGTTSVDLVEELQHQLKGLDLWVAGGCTMHEPEWFSHRENQAMQRMATIGWLA